MRKAVLFLACVFFVLVSLGFVSAYYTVYTEQSAPVSDRWYSYHSAGYDPYPYDTRTFIYHKSYRHNYDWDDDCDDDWCEENRWKYYDYYKYRNDYRYYNFRCQDASRTLRTLVPR